MVQATKILMVEDDGDLQDLLATFLKMTGYEVSGVVDSGEMAIKEVIENPPGLVLMDVNLSGCMDGIETARMVIDIFDIPVIYMSGGLPRERMKEAMETGPVGFQEKPFSRKQLHETIEVGLVTHTIRKKARQHEILPWNSPKTAFIFTDAAGQVLYANEGALALSPSHEYPSLLVPWHEFLCVNCIDGAEGIPEISRLESAGEVGLETAVRNLTMQYRSLYSRQGTRLAWLMEFCEETAGKDSAGMQDSSAGSTAAFEPAPPA